MELWCIDRRASISLTAWHVDDAAVQVAMAVQDGGFTGASKAVWFFRDAFEEFVRALRKFTNDHDGDLRIESINPGEAMLSIRQLDPARHVLAEAQVARGHYLCDRYFYDRVCVTFELDPSQLPDIVRGLESVIAEANIG